MNCDSCPRLKKIIISQLIFIIITNIVIWTSQYKFSYDLHTDLVEIEKIIDQDIANLTSVFGQSLPTKSLEERIFNLIYSKFYKKNHTIIVNGTV
jgi:hypothetical protein